MITDTPYRDHMEKSGYVNSIKKPCLVIGAGHQGLAMAAHLSLNGETVYLWNRTKKNISDVINNGYIECDGIVSGRAIISKASSDIKQVLADTIYVTVPSSAHKDIARVLAPVMPPNAIVYLNPGRTFGAIDFLSELKRVGCQNIPVIVETQSIVYTCRRDGNKAHIFTLKNNIEMAYIGNNCSEEYVLSRLPQCIRDRYTVVDSIMRTSLGNIGMVLHCAPVLLNAGWIESTKWDFRYYYDGISPSIGRVLDIIDNERLKVADKINTKVCSLVEWFHAAYGVKGDSIYECIQNNDSYKLIDAPKSLSHRYLQEDIPNGLVPLEYLAKDIGVEVPATSLIIDLSSLLCGEDYRKTGRKYSFQELRNYVEL